MIDNPPSKIDSSLNRADKNLHAAWREKFHFKKWYKLTAPKIKMKLVSNVRKIGVPKLVSTRCSELSFGIYRRVK